MNAPTDIRSLFTHLIWADRKLFDALPSEIYEQSAILQEFCHIIGSEETWLSRIEDRDSNLAVWPNVARDAIDEQMGETHDAYRRFLAGRSDEDLGASVSYVNSNGDSFDNITRDILLHVALHGQYHRGKVNFMLRQSGHAPAPVDYIAFVRGAPAATRR